jgi:hypothetical protein
VQSHVSGGIKSLVRPAETNEIARASLIRNLPAGPLTCHGVTVSVVVSPWGILLLAWRLQALSTKNNAVSSFMRSAVLIVNQLEISSFSIDLDVELDSGLLV